MDIGKALTFFTEDERWVEKTAIATGLLLVSSLLLLVFVGVLGYFILFGYMVRLAQNVRDDAFPVLPEWDQWGDDLVRGAKLALVYLVWALPLVLVILPLFVIGIVVEEASRYGSNDVAAPFFICALCFSFLFGIAFMVLQPGFTLAYVRNETVRDAFQVSEVWDWTRKNFGNAVIVAILAVIASMILSFVGSIVGVILCVIGMVVTVPLSTVVSYFFQSHLYGQLARLTGQGAAVAAGPAAPLQSGSMGAGAPSAVYQRETEAEPIPESEEEVDAANVPAPPAVWEREPEAEATQQNEETVEQGEAPGAESSSGGETSSGAETPAEEKPNSETVSDEDDTSSEETRKA